MIQDRLQIELRRLAERFRRLHVSQGLAAIWLAAAAIVLAYGGFGVTISWRTAALFLAIAGIVASMLQTGLRFVSRGPSDLTIARRVERKFPELDNCLLTAVEQAPTLADGRYGFLQQAVIQQALTHAENHPWHTVVSTRRLVFAEVVQITAFGFLLFSLTSPPPASKTNIAKKAGKRPVQTEGQFAVTIEPGNTEIERGSSLLVLARVQGPLPADATLVYSSASGEPTRLAMSPSLDDPIFGGRVAMVAQPLDYHVELGQHVTPTYRVNVFEYPRLERADARLVYPSYTGLEERLIQDIRTLSVVEGTDVTLICQLNKPVKSARFVEQTPATTKPGTSRVTKRTSSLEPAVAEIPLPDLALTLRDGNVYETKFSATKTRRLKLELIDDAGRQNTEQAVIVVQVVPNQPPTFKLAFPGRDLEVSPLEELDVKATTWDDYGVKRMGINYGLAGKPATEVVLGENAAARQKHELTNVIRFEDLHAEPDQLLAYYFWAEDSGPDGQLRRTSSDMYFAEVRHFDEIFREGQQQAGGQQQRQQQGNQNTQAAQQLAQVQKDIINATWNLIRRETGTKHTKPFVEDVGQISQSQTNALEEATKLGESVRDVESQSHLLAVLEAMQLAIKHLQTAHSQPSISELQPALIAEQAAYQALLKLRAREHEVVRQQQQQSSAGSQAGRSQQQRQQMQQLDLKDEENRYEAQRLAQAQQEQPEDRETRQVLNRLRELARRQHDLNERLKDLQSALQEAANEQKKEEIRQQLKRLQDEQRDVLRDTDELQSRMETPENQERMADERQQLEQAREQVQRASESLEGDKVTQAAASGTRAEKEFEELRNEFRKRASGQFNDQMRDMRDAARDLDQQEKEVAEKLAETTKPGPQKKSLRDEDNQSGEIADRLNQQKERLGNLSERLKQTVQEAEQTEPLLTEKLADAARNLQDQNVEKALEVAGRSARQGLLDDAREVERVASRGISQLRAGIEKAAESVLGDETEALRRAREQLKNLAQELNQEIAQNAPEERLPSIPGGEPGTAGENPQPNGETPQNAPGRPGQNRNSRKDSPGEAATAGTPNGEGSTDKPQSEKQPPGPSQPMPGGSPEGQPGESQNGKRPGNEPMEGGNPMPAGEGQGAGQQPGQQPGEQPGTGGQPSATVRGNQRPGQNPQRGGQQGSRGQSGTNQGGLSAGGGGQEEMSPERAAPIAGDGFLEWSDRLRDVEEMVDDPELRAEAARIRDAARAIRSEFKRHSKAPNWNVVRANVAEPLVELTNRVAEELLRRNSKQAIVPLDRDPVPPKYSEKTRRYYERLGSGQ